MCSGSRRACAGARARTAALPRRRACQPRLRDAPNLRRPREIRPRRRAPSPACRVVTVSPVTTSRARARGSRRARRIPHATSTSWALEYAQALAGAHLGARVRSSKVLDQLVRHQLKGSTSGRARRVNRTFQSRARVPEVKLSPTTRGEGCPLPSVGIHCRRAFASFMMQAQSPIRA